MASSILDDILNSVNRDDLEMEIKNQSLLPPLAPLTQCVHLIFSGGAPRIGDVFEFIHDTFVDSEYTKTGIPLNVVLISDGQTQGDDREAMEKWTRILKKVVSNLDPDL